MNILQVNSSSRYKDSVTRNVSDQFIRQLEQPDTSFKIKQRDVAKGLPFVNEDWLNANFTAAEQRSDQQKNVLATSDSLVQELQEADVIVISLPVYNFSVPATLKAWIDLVARVGITFNYTDKGPVGLLENKKAYIVYASGGTQIGSDIDFASGYLRHVLGFLGIDDVEFVVNGEIQHTIQ